MPDMTVDDLRPVSRWSADCAERVLALYEAKVPGDARVRDAIEGARRFGNGAARDKQLRTLALAALAASGETDDPAAKAAARAAQSAAAVGYTHLDLTGVAGARQTKHVLGAAVYAALAAGDAEIQWAAEHSSEAVRKFLQWMPEPEAGRTRQGDLYRALDMALRG